MRGRRGFKRKRKRLWFPVLGQEENAEGFLPVGEFWSFYTGQLIVGTTPATAHPMDVIGLTYDYPTEVETNAGQIPSLADWQASQWHLDGIVGKCHVGLAIDGDASNLQLLQEALIAAWFCVLKVDDTGTPRDDAAQLINYSTLFASNIREPYIWRRTWMLGRGLVSNNPTGSGALIELKSQFPEGNYAYGSSVDGPHIDAKSRRFISKDERLFFGIEAIRVAGGVGPVIGGNNIAVNYLLDFRLIGQMRQSTARRSSSM